MTIETEKTKNIPVIVSSSDEYSIYIPVLLNALKQNSNQAYQYNVYVLDSGLTNASKATVSAYVKTLGNFSIDYLDVNYYVEKYKDLWFICAHFSVATYIRFFIPELLPDLDKVIYLDLDLCVNGDVSELFQIDIGDYAVGAAVDVCYERETYYDTNGLLEYNKNVVGYPLDYKAFNAGVLIINLKKWRELDITEKCIQRLGEIKMPRVLDQCVLNSLFCRGLVYELPTEWNYLWHSDIDSMEYPTTSQKMNEVIEACKKAKSQIKIVHYTTSTKPWNIYCEPAGMHDYVLEVELAPLWWNYARGTPFYEKILTLNITHNVYQKADERTSSKKYLLGLFKIKKTADTKRYYLLGVRIAKRVKNNGSKSVYLFNIPVMKKKR